MDKQLRLCNKIKCYVYPFIVERIHKPVIDEPLTKQVTVRQGLNAKLECKAWSVGIPEFTWKRWDIELNSWQGLQGSIRVCMTHESYKTRSAIPDQSQHGAILLIRNVTKMDEGNYSCVVKNKHGTDEMEMSLCVLDKGELGLNCGLSGGRHSSKGFTFYCWVETLMDLHVFLDNINTAN